jgi:hypothetical protein
VLAVCAAAALASGCATVPTVGQPQPVTGVSGQAQQQFVQPIPPVPEPGWTAQEIVEGFLAASASFANNHAAARQFLAPPLRKSFDPGFAVTVVSGSLRPSSKRVGPHNLEGESIDVDTVSLTGQQLATINTIGQYIDNPGPHRYVFRLERFSGQWLITELPSASAVLMTQSDFEQVYQPRNLYLYAPGSLELVPEPVFAPQQDTYADVASNLVDALVMAVQQKSWLARATTSAFPGGTYRIGKVAIVGSNAVVNLGGGVTEAAPQELQEMAAQLVNTLTSTSYGQPPISKSVTLEINGQVADVGGTQSQDFAATVPGSHVGLAPLYYISASGAVSELAAGRGRPVRGTAGRGQIPFGMIAVSPSTPAQLAGALATGRGCDIYYGSLGGSGPLSHRTVPGSSRCSSLSWDSLGDIWAVNGTRIWVLPAGDRQPVAISLPQLPGFKPPSYRVLALRVAPDGVRVAMLVQKSTGGRDLLLTAVTRANKQISLGPSVTIGTRLTTTPTSLSWYDPDHLIVLAGSQLYEVPVNGGEVVTGGPVPRGTESITAAGPGQIAAVSQGEILTSSGPQQIQQPAVKGTSPAYPG